MFSISPNFWHYFHMHYFPHALFPQSALLFGAHQPDKVNAIPLTFKPCGCKGNRYYTENLSGLPHRCSQIHLQQPQCEKNAITQWAFRLVSPIGPPSIYFQYFMVITITDTYARASRESHTCKHTWHRRAAMKPIIYQLLCAPFFGRLRNARARHDNGLWVERALDAITYSSWRADSDSVCNQHSQTGAAAAQLLATTEPLVWFCNFSPVKQDAQSVGSGSGDGDVNDGDTAAGRTGKWKYRIIYRGHNVRVVAQHGRWFVASCQPDSCTFFSLCVCVPAHSADNRNAHNRLRRACAPSAIKHDDDGTHEYGNWSAFANDFCDGGRCCVSTCGCACAAIEARFWQFDFHTNRCRMQAGRREFETAQVDDICGECNSLEYWF